jgi:hypothetical protein
VAAEHALAVAAVFVAEPSGCAAGLGLGRGSLAAVTAGSGMCSSWLVRVRCRAVCAALCLTRSVCRGLWSRWEGPPRGPWCRCQAGGEHRYPESTRGRRGPPRGPAAGGERWRGVASGPQRGRSGGTRPTSRGDAVGRAGPRCGPPLARWRAQGSSSRGGSSARGEATPGDVLLARVDR